MVLFLCCSFRITDKSENSFFFSTQRILVLSQMAQWVNNPPAMQEIQETPVPFLVWDDPLEETWQPTAVFLLENSLDRGAWQATVQRVTKNQTRLSD